MQCFKQVISRLIGSGLGAEEAAAMMALAMAEITLAEPKKSSAAIRQQRYRDAKKETPDRNESVTKRNESVTRLPVTNRNESVTNRNDVTRAHIYTSLVSKKERLPRRKPRYALPPDFELTDPMRDFAAKRKWPPPKIDRQFEKFKYHHIGKGTLAASWPMTWQTWVLNDYDAKNDPPVPGAPFDVRKHLV